MKTALVSICLVAWLASSAVAQEQQPAAPAAPAVEVKTTESIHALVLPMKGSYIQHADVFGRLMTELGTLGQAPAGPIFGLYFDDPTQVPEANLTWEVGVPVGPGVKARAPFVIKDVPGGMNAVIPDAGSWESAASGWQTLIEWVFANGYRPTGSAMQIYHGDPTQSGVAGPHTELRLPVAK